MSRTKQEKNKALVLEADLLRMSVNREIQSRIVEHGFVSQEQIS